MKVKIDKADRVFSWFIRTRDDWRCTRCGAYHEPPTTALHASHFWGRSRESTRFDPENVDAHCMGCHRHLGSNPAEFAEWKRKQLGDNRFKALMIRQNAYQKKDRKMAYIVWDKLMKEECEKKGTRLM